MLLMKALCQNMIKMLSLKVDLSFVAFETIENEFIEKR